MPRQGQQSQVLPGPLPHLSPSVFPLHLKLSENKNQHDAMKVDGSLLPKMYVYALQAGDIWGKHAQEPNRVSFIASFLFLSFPPTPCHTPGSVFRDHSLRPVPRVPDED